MTGRSLVRYGERPNQVAELWLPAAPAGPLPVVVLLHGGFWRGIYTKHLLHGLAGAVVARGWAAWNVEYRRVGFCGRGGGWPATGYDVAAAVAHLRHVPAVDPGRVALCGHSAGAQLALWAAARARVPMPGAPDRHGDPALEPVTVRGAVSLAGVVDLVGAVRLGLGRGAVEAFMGGTPAQCPDRYADASPAALVPLGVPQFVVHGLGDRTVPSAMSEAYVASAVAAGDQVQYSPVPAIGHMAVVDAGGPAWQCTAGWLGSVL